MSLFTSQDSYSAENFLVNLSVLVVNKNYFYYKIYIFIYYILFILYIYIYKICLLSYKTIFDFLKSFFRCRI